MKSLFRLEDLEFSQAQLRLVVAFVVSLYALIMYPLGLLDADLLKAILVTGALFTLLSVLLLAHLWFLPQPMVSVSYTHLTLPTIYSV